MQKYDWLGIILTAIAALIIWFVCEKTGMMRANTNDPTLDYYIKAALLAVIAAKKRHGGLLFLHNLGGFSRLKY